MRPQHDSRRVGIRYGLSEGNQTEAAERNAHHHRNVDPPGNLQHRPQHVFFQLLTAQRPAEFLNVRPKLNGGGAGLPKLIGKLQPLVAPAALQGCDHRDIECRYRLAELIKMLLDVQFLRDLYGVPVGGVVPVVARDVIALFLRFQSRAVKRGKDDCARPRANGRPGVGQRQGRAIGLDDDGTGQGQSGEGHVDVRHRCTSIEGRGTFGKLE